MWGRFKNVETFRSLFRESKKKENYANIAITKNLFGGNDVM